MIVDDTGYPDDSLDHFREVVLEDEALQARLGNIVSADVFVVEAKALASRCGMVLDEQMVIAAMRPDLLGIGRFLPAPLALDRWPSRGWLPARSVPTEAAPAFDWAWFGAEPLIRPFFEEEVRQFAPRPFSEMFRTRTSLRSLVGDARAADRAPAGFVFHMSRCGSTLVAQMLAADPAHVVLSEPEPLDAVVRWALESGAPLDEQVAALRAVIAALGHDRTGMTQRVFAKVDSWHAIALPLFRAAFPETPWVFLYRDPIEILVSQMRQRGMHTVPGLLPSSIIAIEGGEMMAAERYAAQVLARVAEAVIDHWTVGGGLLVDYAELPDAVMDRIFPHFGLCLDEHDRAAIVATAGRNAKAPDQPFVPDSSDKRREATPAVQGAAEEYVYPVLERLESLRQKIHLSPQVLAAPPARYHSSNRFH